MKESTNSPDFLSRTALLSVWTGLLLGLAVAIRWDWETASGFVVALFWGLANFAVLAVILKTATNPDGFHTGRLAGWIALKIFGLYGLAILVLFYRWFPLAAFPAGFSWPLAVALLRALGSRFTRGNPRDIPRSVSSE